MSGAGGTLSEARAQALLADLNDPEAVAPLVLERWARHDPLRVAIRYGEDGSEITYGALARDAARIAGSLAAAGVGPGERVCVLTRNALEAARWMFGIWRAAAVYCPINFNFRGELLAYQLADTAPASVLVERELLEPLQDALARAGLRPRVVVHRAPADALATAPLAEEPLGDRPIDAAAFVRPDAPPVVAAPAWHDAASIIYTSGTTGPSKGVVQSHRWMNQYTWAVRRLLTEEDVVYNDLPLYHVGGAMFNVLRALWMGASVSLWDRFSSTAFWERVAAHGATSAVLLDVMIPWLLNAPVAVDDHANTLNKVHMQPLPLHHAEVARRFGFDFVTAAFGQSESGVLTFAVLEELEAGEGTPAALYRGHTHAEMRELMRASSIPVVAGESVTRKGYMGEPMPYADVAVLGEHDEPTPPGEIGELVVRPRLPGILLDRYHAKPEATAHALRNAWFHTGDAACAEADGAFYFVDRLGDRIRRRGENVSSFHVEDLLNRHPGVRACAVVGVPSDEGDEDDIVAFVEPADDALAAEELSGWAVAHLPGFMRPQHVVFVDELPRTPTNKIEKHKLRAAFPRDGGS